MLVQVLAINVFQPRRIRGSLIPEAEKKKPLKAIKARGSQLLYRVKL